jgi:hypothetical protein
MTGKQAAFFFGSGISYKSKAASVTRITEDLLHGKWEWHTMGRFVRAAQCDDKAERVQTFLTRLSDEMKSVHSAAGWTPHYEELFSAVLQIQQHLRDEIVNPIVAPFIRDFAPRIADILAAHSAIGGRDVFTSLTENTINLANCVVYELLSEAQVPVEMSAISEVAALTDRVDIFTLNHDLLVERELERTKTKYSDGFDRQNKDLREFNSGWPNAPVRIYKLHGSINWFRAELPGYVQYVVPLIPDVDHLRTANGFLVTLFDNGLPYFLSGTNVKEQSYGTYLIGDLFSRLREVLNGHNTLIVSGYGWLDREVNHRLGQWLGDRAETKLVILHGRDPDELRNKPFWRMRWAKYYGKKLEVIPRYLCDCTGTELAKYLDPI